MAKIVHLKKLGYLFSTQLRPSPLTAFAKSLALALDGFDLYCPRSKQLRKIGGAKKIAAKPGFEPKAAG